MLDLIDRDDTMEDLKFENVWGYDIETYPNFFCAVFVNFQTGQRWIFEISPRRNDGPWLHWFLTYLINRQAIMVGYNSIGFDYPVIHHFLMLCEGQTDAWPEAIQLYLKAQAIIDTPFNDWSQSVAPWDQKTIQLDLFKLMHFDNFARSTSLKKLEVAMRSVNVEDLPVKPGTNLTLEEMPPMIDYCCWDVSETIKFAKLVWDRVEFRQELDRELGGRMSRLNYNDTKIGKEYFLAELRDQGVQTHNGKAPRQTLRATGIKVSDFILPIEFEHPELKRIYEFLFSSVIPPSQTKGYFSDLVADVNGFEIVFGSGGIHASINNKTVHSDDDYVVIDADVTSYYPSIAIEWGFYPEHMGEKFLPIYADLKKQRLTYDKKSTRSGMLKLALNGTYGESNNKHSAFFDPQMTMAITINGQLLLTKLMEILLGNSAVEPIQMNTDGLTIRMPRSHLDWYYEVCKVWETWSKMELEFVEYRTMAIRDVNNYISVAQDGKVKRKNAYLTDPDWHQDHSSLVVPKAVSALIEHGTPIDEFIYGHTDAYDFMRSVKVPRNSSLRWGDEKVQNVSRYYIALDGEYLTKVMPPLAGSDDDREFAIDKDWQTQLCNKAWDFDWHNLNRRWYLNEAEKLVAGLGL